MKSAVTTLVITASEDNGHIIQAERIHDNCVQSFEYDGTCNRGTDLQLAQELLLNQILNALNSLAGLCELKTEYNNVQR